MGKTKRARAKFHASAAKESASTALTTTSLAAHEALLPPVAVPDSLFAGLDLPGEVLKQSLADFDAKSVISSRMEEKGTQLKKKEKRQIRHEVFLKKMEAVSQARKEAQAKKRKKQHAKSNPVAHLSELSEALPTLESIDEEARTRKDEEKQKECKKKAKGTPKLKVRQKLMMKDISLFQQVLNHPVYKKDPEGTIAAHIHHQMIMEASQDP